MFIDFFTFCFARLLDILSYHTCNFLFIEFCASLTFSTSAEYVY